MEDAEIEAPSDLESDSGKVDIEVEDETPAQVDDAIADIAVNEVTNQIETKHVRPSKGGWFKHGRPSWSHVGIVVPKPKPETDTVKQDADQDKEHEEEDAVEDKPAQDPTDEEKPAEVDDAAAVVSDIEVKIHSVQYPGARGLWTSHVKPSKGIWINLVRPSWSHVGIVLPKPVEPETNIIKQDADQDNEQDMDALVEEKPAQEDGETANIDEEVQTE